MGTAAKLAVAVVALVVAGMLFFVLQEDDGSEPATTAVQTTTEVVDADPAGPGDDDSTSKPDKPDEPEPKPEVPTIVIEAGQPVGGVQELTFTKGEEIRFVVESDVADHVHLHGYNAFQDIAAGGTARFDVAATIEGVFEVELEDTVVPIAEITVEPN